MSFVKSIVMVHLLSGFYTSGLKSRFYLVQPKGIINALKPPHRDKVMDHVGEMESKLYENPSHQEMENMKHIN